MVEVDSKHASRAQYLGLLLPAVLLSGCISAADTFRSKADEPPDSGASVSTAPNGETLASQPTDVASSHSSTTWSGSTEEATTAASADGNTTHETSRDVSEDAGSAPASSVGDVPPELLGVWQRAGAYGNAYDGQFGETFSVISDLSVRLEMTAQGQYRWVYLATGALGDCASASRRDESTGTAVLDGNTLTLRPSTRRVDTANCETESSTVTELEPIALAVRLTEARAPVGGLRTFSMAIEGYGPPVTLTSLFRQPTYVPEQPELPEEFVLGVNGAVSDLQGSWSTPEAASASNFYDPGTDVFDFAALSAEPQRWLRFDGDEYELAVGLQDVNVEGVCELDLIYHERGTGVFEVLEDVDDLGTDFIGHAAFEAKQSRLAVNVRGCGDWDGEARYELDPLTSYFRWDYSSPGREPEAFALSCDFPQSEWQSLVCDDGSVTFVRPE